MLFGKYFYITASLKLSQSLGMFEVVLQDEAPVHHLVASLHSVWVA